jgi:benzoyl-CoA reductase/2-hydroxyglutaryl-CoA dehydratase subunit BcrC/BadD/HgdB
MTEKDTIPPFDASKFETPKPLSTQDRLHKMRFILKKTHNPDLKAEIEQEIERLELKLKEELHPND